MQQLTKPSLRLVKKPAIRKEVWAALSPKERAKELHSRGILITVTRRLIDPCQVCDKQIDPGQVVRDNNRYGHAACVDEHIPLIKVTPEAKKSICEQLLEWRKDHAELGARLDEIIWSLPTDP